ncbi:SusC/RagA family TonB-linked outer membrane protein [Chryseolinea lacunae]|uniref:TonB-dependent receptor n=1 Tax=Chryseolinea lacunae TaxID=2801331 RepID=A0ABS1KXU1_9BACT|nr:TonB-dependent receptor [Chryseolinea lacunae]MBL0744271.1 TonB-dependent receptor [Chryseolinea lacunae]
MRTFLLTLFLAVLGTQVLAQNRTVTGKVTDAEDGSPLPGVSVLVQGTTRGMATDLNGAYSLELGPGEDVITFSFIGYKAQTITVGDQTTVNVVMETDATQLNEVVVVGYGEQKKSDITGATANVKGEELSKQPVLTATQAMQGKVAGVQIISSGQPGASPQIRVRGVGTALSGTTSLYVVDGVLTDDITNINTADIVDMTILKDASAAAIYGSRGANGVIIITTRKGSVGAMKITYNNNIGIRQAANLVQMANSAEYSNYVQAAVGTPPPASSYNTDWYKTILRTAWEQSHNLSISGGSDKSTYLFNVGYLNDEGIVIGNEFKRLTLRLNNDYQIRENLKFGFQSSYGNSINQNGFNVIDIDTYGNVGSVYSDAYRAAPFIPSIVDGRYGNTSAYGNVGNPLLDVKSNDVKVKENRMQGSGYLSYKPVSWLTLRTSLGADWKNSLNRQYNYQFNPDETTFVVAGGNQLRALSALNIKQIQTFRWVWDNTATINKSFGKHDFTLLVGTTAEKYNQTWISANRNDVPADPNLWYINVGDANSSQNDGKGDAWARNSYLGRLNYAYGGKYLLTGTFRVDGSSRLPKVNRFQSFPSVGAAWVVSREGFMQGQGIFDLLKLRASYGKVGNDQIPTDAYTKSVTLNKPYPYNGSTQDATNGALIEQIIDPNINWEITKEYDVALEFAILQSKLTGEVNYYDKKVENALIKVPVNLTSGDGDKVIYTNVASIQNRGVEVVLNWKDKIGDDFSYTIGGNVTFNKNKVLALNGGQAVYGGSVGAGQGFTTYTDNGQPVGSFYVYKTLGVFNSEAEISAYTNSAGKVIQPTAKPGDFRYLDKNDDGVIDDSDREFAGSYQPVAYFGVNLGANYKSWDFSLSIYANVGNKVYNGKKAARVYGTDNVEKDMVYKRWTSANHTQSEPSANTGNLPASDYFVESGSFARINNLTIGYTLPAALLERWKIANLRVFVTSQNLFTYKKYSGFTAELPGDPLSSGIELTSYPTTRTFAAGLNVGF